MQHVKIMKEIKNAFFAICLIVLNVLSVFAADEPLPEPNPGPPATPNEELPINDHIVLMLILAIVLGGIMIYRHKIKKASM